MSKTLLHSPLNALEGMKKEYVEDFSEMNSNIPSINSLAEIPMEFSSASKELSISTM